MGQVEQTWEYEIISFIARTAILTMKVCTLIPIRHYIIHQKINCQAIINMILCFRSKIQQGVNRKRNVETKNEKEILILHLHCEKMNRMNSAIWSALWNWMWKLWLWKDKKWNAAMICESTYTISKYKDLPMKTLSKIMKCDHETFLLRTSQWKRKPQNICNCMKI